jgi:hypothetical protein
MGAVMSGVVYQELLLRMVNESGTCIDQEVRMLGTVTLL